MRLGIDFGTTHTVAALIDRGNYPVVPLGDHDVCPSLIAAHTDGRVLYGREAAAVLTTHQPGWHGLRSVKRLLHGAGPLTEVQLAGRTFLLRDLCAGFLAHVREIIAQHVEHRPKEVFEAAISVPANASSGQRMLTVDAFEAAGFTVVRLLNEPSAAACEYAHRQKRTLTSQREHLLVYDLGGGTFDASVLRLDEQGGEVVGSAGISRLGGDDFDQVIYQLALENIGLAEDAAPLLFREFLLEECRVQKEAVNPSTRKLVLDLAPALAAAAPEWPAASAIPETVVLSADAVYAACGALIEASLTAMDDALGDARYGAGIAESELAGIYVVGGQSNFPPVYRTLRERFGQNRVHRSPHPFGSIAIGLAIHLAEAGSRRFAEKLTRHIGVFREEQSGREISCDVLLAKDTPLPPAGAPPVEVRRRYKPRHNIGHFRFFECARIQAGRPEGNLALWDAVRFPFDKRLRDTEDLSGVEVERGGERPEVEEVIRAFPGGEVEVELRVLEDGFTRTAKISPRGAVPGNGPKRRGRERS
jgi:molecular chaperone DnaK (HSP70)